MRSAMCAASQLPGRGPRMWMMTLHLHINEKSDYNILMLLAVPNIICPYLSIKRKNEDE